VAAKTVWTKSKIISSIKEWADVYGEPPSAEDWRILAGFTPRPQGQKRATPKAAKVTDPVAPSEQESRFVVGSVATMKDIQDAVNAVLGTVPSSIRGLEAQVHDLARVESAQRDRLVAMGGRLESIEREMADLRRAHATTEERLIEERRFIPEPTPNGTGHNALQGNWFSRMFA
jgi:chromosome segregation ATPase